MSKMLTKVIMSMLIFEGILTEITQDSDEFLKELDEILDTYVYQKYYLREFPIPDSDKVAVLVDESYCTNGTVCPEALKDEADTSYADYFVLKPSQYVIIALCFILGIVVGLIIAKFLPE